MFTHNRALKNVATESLMYVGETPWMTAGTRLLTPPATTKEAIEKSRLDWRVDLKQLQIPGGPLVDRFAAVRSSDERVLGTVGPKFRTIQNSDAFAFFDPMIAKGHASIEAAGSLKKGARIFVLAKLNSPDAMIVPKADDRVAKNVVLAHGHDGSLAVHVSVTAVRWFCTNVLAGAIGKGTNTVRIRHTAGAAAALKRIQTLIERADHDFDKVAEVFRALAGVYVTEAMIRAYVDRVFPAPKVQPQSAIAAAMDEWNDGPTEADIGAESTADDSASIFGSLLARPFVPTEETEIETDSRHAAMAVESEKRRIGDNIIEIFEKGGRRGDLNLEGVRGTGWAAYNAVTEYLTWERGRDADNRMSSLWFQGGEGVTQRAITAAAETFLGKTA